MRMLFVVRVNELRQCIISTAKAASPESMPALQTKKTAFKFDTVKEEVFNSVSSSLP